MFFKRRKQHEKTLKQLSLLFFLALVITLFPLSLVHGAASGADAAQSEAKVVEAIPGIKSCGDYNWKLSSDNSCWSAVNISYVAYIRQHRLSDPVQVGG